MAPPAAPVGQHRAAAVPHPLPPTAEALSWSRSPSGYINEIFSKALRLTVQIDQQVSTRTDIVTLRTGGRCPPSCSGWPRMCSPGTASAPARTAACCTSPRKKP